MSTSIEWTDETWNPVTGCTKVSQGCKNCYAERLAPKVFAGQYKVGPMTSRPRVFTDVVTHPDRLETPLHWKKPRRVFVNSMSDLFHEDVPEEFILSVFVSMAMAKQHTFQILTKRPQRMLDWFALQPAHRVLTTEREQIFYSFPLPNVWLGVSVEDQDTADERIALLLQTPAAVHFLSCEPLLGPINLSIHLRTTYGTGRGYNKIDWVIAGGESGPRARPSHPDWFRSLRDQCAAAGVPFFFKQWGEYVQCETELVTEPPWNEFYPMDLSIELKEGRAYKVIEEHGNEYVKVGKKAAGRTLDGRLHDEYPE